MHFSWKLSGYIVTLNRILVKCFNQASLKSWYSIHIVIYIHIYNGHLRVTSLCHEVPWLCCFITLWQFTKATLLPSSLACNCSAASLEWGWFHNSTTIVLCGCAFFFLFFPSLSMPPLPRWLNQPWVCGWIPTNSTELDSIRELGGEHWGWAVIPTKADTYLVLPLRDGEKIFLPQNVV